MKTVKFCGLIDLIVSVLVNQLSNNAGISVWRSVWVTRNCCFRGYISCESKFISMLKQAARYEDIWGNGEV